MRLRLRAAALSLCLHLALLGGIAWRARSESRPRADLEVQAPLGDVFVQEQRGGTPAHAARAAPPARGEPPAAAAPRNVTGGAPSAAGLPTGEAKPVGVIRPAYPPLSRKLGEEGEAVFTLTISPSGTVESAELETSSGHDRLDAAAKAALLAARFQNEDGTASVKRFRVEFRLSSR